MKRRKKTPTNKLGYTAEDYNRAKPDRDAPRRRAWYDGVVTGLALGDGVVTGLALGAPLGLVVAGLLRLLG